MPEDTEQAGEQRRRFQALVLPHLDDAVNFAWWLAGNRADAEDIVQEAMLRAYKYFDRFTGERARPWLLTIVRNTSATWMQRNRPRALVLVSDSRDEADMEAHRDETMPSPETQSEHRELGRAIDRAVAALPQEFREVILLREVEELSYKEIAHVVDVPIGTVMSRLARARKLLQARLKEAVG